MASTLGVKDKGSDKGGDFAYVYPNKNDYGLSLKWETENYHVM